MLPEIVSIRRAKLSYGGSGLNVYPRKEVVRQNTTFVIIYYSMLSGELC